ncbi:unnamed protein product, partial [Amoebophrya sp. A25]
LLLLFSRRHDVARRLQARCAQSKQTVRTTTGPWNNEGFQAVLLSATQRQASSLARKKRRYQQCIEAQDALWCPRRAVLTPGEPRLLRAFC